MLYSYDPRYSDIDIREELQTTYELVVRKFDKREMILSPSFQRGFVGSWANLVANRFLFIK